MRTATVVGSTGVTGRAIVRYLLNSEHYARVISLSRQSLGIEDHPKLDARVVDFNQDDWRAQVMGDDLFSALGTTLKQAGSQDAQYAIDYQLQADVAKTARANGVSRLFLVSAPYANENSLFFYTRIKGKLETDVKSLGFDVLYIYHPPIIQGDRPDDRIAERLGAGIMNAITAIVPGSENFRPIQANDLGRAIVYSAEDIGNEEPQGGKLSYLSHRDIRRLLKSRARMTR